MQVYHSEDFGGAGAEFDRLQLRALLLRRVQASDQLAHPRAIEIRHVAKVQQEFLPAVLYEIQKQFVNRFSFDEGETASYVDYRNISKLTSAGTESQSIASPKGLFYLRRAAMPNARITPIPSGQAELVSRR